MRVTIRDVAAQAGVSINTVSRVLNDRRDVKPATRARVQQVIAELDYRPNSLARSLIRRSSRTVGLVVTDCTNPNTARQIQVVQREMAAAGYAVLIFDTQEDGAQQRAALDLLEENVVDGVILTATGNRDGSLTGLSRRLPLVLLNRESEEPTACDLVLNDNAGGARAATEHLIGLGHRRIAYVTAHKNVSTVRDRLAGYQAALAAADLSVDQPLARAEITIADAAAATAALLERPQRPTAILAYNDLMAVGVLSALTEAGLKVPGDVALVGYDDIAYAPYLRVPLTTVRQQTERMGETAARLLLDRVGGAEMPPRRVVLAPELIVRTSSGAAAR